MKLLTRVLPLLTAAFLFSACESAPNPVGEWRVDMDRTVAANPELFGAEMSEERKMQAKEGLAAMKLTLRADGKALMAGGPEVESADWSLEGDQLMMANGPAPAPTSITIEGDTIVMQGFADGSGRVLYLSRAGN